MKVIQFINLGGPVNWVLAALLCFSFCQCLERTMYFFRPVRDQKEMYFSGLEKICLFQKVLMKRKK